MTKKKLNKWVLNLAQYTVPIFLSTFFAQLALGVDFKAALLASMPTLWGAFRDYLNKRK